VWCRTNPGKTDKGKQDFKKYGCCIFAGKCKQVTTDRANLEEAPGGKHVTSPRGRPGSNGGNGGQGPAEMPGAG
jgi:hypothetical protein